MGKRNPEQRASKATGQSPVSPRCDRAVGPDLERYLPYLDGFDLTEAEKVELIQTLWRFTENFVDRAFKVHPVQRGLLAPEAEHSNLGTLRLDSCDGADSNEIGPSPAAVMAEGHSDEGR